MPRPTLAMLIICHQRQAELELALASIRGEGFDEVVVVDMASTPPLRQPAGARLVRSDRNRGVSAGRNLLAREATADVLVFMDDDAVMEPGAAERLRAHFADPEAAALVAFRIRRPHGIERWEQPFRPGPIPDAPVECAYFVGAGHAVRRDAFLQAGGYHELNAYGGEELDLSFKLLKAGHDLLYDPRVVVEHRPSLSGRAPRPGVPAMVLHHRLVVARAHLPWPAAVVHALAWIALTARDAARLPGGLGLWRRGLGAGLRAPVDRRPLPWRVALEVHRRRGRLLY